eukprot:TRINITY_DN2582_c1_g4_i1.p1 TRINITY_DN2582_c1_g4~~TRINITY_DN2582_c1_g4_i1.p1  ORF type:complete len:120 (-),score=18.11 TRINITY_DN2582_c1_g4_i1:233-592(-)
MSQFAEGSCDHYKDESLKAIQDKLGRDRILPGYVYGVDCVGFGDAEIYYRSPFGFFCFRMNREGDDLIIITPFAVKTTEEVECPASKLSTTENDPSIAGTALLKSIGKVATKDQFTCKN